MSGASSRGRWLPPALWAVVVVTSSSWPNPDLPPVPSGSDKVTHLALYGVLGFLLGRAGPELVGRGRALAATWLGLALFAVVDEWHQRFIPGRSTDPRDWGADVLGAALGLLLAAGLRRRALRAAGAAGAPAV